MKIRLIGQRNNLGIGTHYANFVDALRRRPGYNQLIEEVDFTNFEQLDRAVQQSQPEDINISFVGMDIKSYMKGCAIQWVVFESTIIAPKFLHSCKNSDQVWVPSTWGQSILIANGVPADKVHVVPEGVDADRYYPVGRPRCNRPLRYLFVGKYEDRKSCTELIDAWAEVMGANTSVELIIKTNYFVDAPDKWQALQNHVNSKGLNNLIAIWGEYDSKQLFDLYATSDVFVFPTKGEAWGLPVIEAAAMGLPIITTNYSAQQDYLADITSSCIFVDYTLGPITCPDYQQHYEPTRGSWGNWAIPDPTSLKVALLAAESNYQTLAENATKNSKIIRKNWNWTQSVDQALVAMESIAGF